MDYSLATHVTPGHLIYLSNIDCYISEKADGTYCNKIPEEVFDNKFNLKIEAEYIRAKNLYLIFNVTNDELKNLNYFQRLNWMREKYNLPIIESNYENYHDEIKKDRVNLDINIKQNKVKWWIKGCWKLPKGKEFLSKINEINSIEQNNIFPTDGWIITPFNNKNIGKLKPKNELTIDLLNVNNNWLSRDKKFIIVKNKKSLKNGIYRCYWDNNLKSWVPRERRFDKKKPNPSSIIYQLTSFHNHPWELKDITNLDKFCKYYKLVNTNLHKDTIEYLSIQRKFSLDWIKKSFTGNEKLMFDLGCGRGGSVDIWKSFNSKWVGVDIDLAAIYKSSTYNIDSTWIWLDFNTPWTIPGQIKKLGNTWKAGQFHKWRYLKNKFDGIIGNLSIHNCGNNINNIINELNNISKKGTILKLSFPDLDKLKNLNKNINLPNGRIELIKKEKIYLKIKFDWIHENDIIEPTLSSKYLISKLKNWKLREKFYFNITNNTWNKWQKNIVYLTLIKL